MAVPKHPVVFTKPANALAGPLDDIHIHPEVQEQLDYEGELTVVIGRDAKNVQANEALSYVLGYTCGNDFSARDYQVPSTVSGGQYSYAKSFDQFAPIGPCITSAALIPDPQALSYVTKVNGEVRQKTSTADMIHSVKQVIAHLSRGTTLRKCTCIMMGTPSGVGLWMSPPRFLKDGDVVEVDIEQIGAIRNIVVFD
jgi:2-keto-4-pentenoate hydratase/2-oxohepta-3-ene-1,7-dioic acid hydratase in catechol pathway